MQPDNEPVVATDSLEEKELILSGIVVNQQGALKAYSRIYQLIFDLRWVAAHLETL